MRREANVRARAWRGVGRAQGTAVGRSLTSGKSHPSVDEMQVGPLVDHLLLLTIEEAADCLRVHRSKLYELVATGELKSIKVGRLRRILVRDLDAFVDRLASEQGGQR